MRHKIAGKKLGRNSALRYATIRDIAKATLIHQQVRTTKAKAKEARKLVEKLITMGKKGTLAHRRRAFAILCDHEIVSDLFNKTSPRFKNRLGGYTRIITLGNRRGDNAQLALLELTEKEIIVPKEPAVKTASSKKEKEVVETTATEVKAPKVEKKVKEDKKAEMKETEVMREDAGSIKKKPGPGIVGGFKKMFTKKPPSSGGK